MSHPSSSSLPILQNITKFNNTVTRILAQNPGPYTLQGTNTYLISGSKSSFLIDTGQGLSPYIPFLESVLKVNPPVSDIILTHYHGDHVKGITSVLDSIRSINKKHIESSQDFKKPKVWKFKLKNPDHNSLIKLDEEAIDTELIKSYLETIDERDEVFERLPMKDQLNAEPQYRYIHWLQDSQTFEISDQLHLKIIHTPGHTNDSISCALFSNPTEKTEEQTNKLDAMFVGDTVLGGSTTIFDDLSAYLKSLEKLRKLIQTNHQLNSSDPASNDTNVRLYPGHGDVIENGLEKIEEYIQHRIEREKQILGYIAYEPNSTTTEELMKLIYNGKLPERVIPAALRGLRLHLRKLVEEDQVKEIELDRWARSKEI